MASTLAFPGLAIPGATYPGMAYRYKFTPPVVYRAMLDNPPPFERTKYPMGLNVVKDSFGGYSIVEDMPDESTYVAIYQGGHEYYISDDEAAALTAAGYEVIAL